MTSRLLSILLLTLALEARAAEPAAGGPCGLPASLRDAVQQRYGAARVLKASDLFDDERALFSADHPGACPGMTHGMFFGARERAATALVLMDVEPKKNIRLVVARPAMATWTFQEVDELDQGSTPVVLKKGPGKYADPRDAATRLAGTDAVVLTGYETWERIYVWNGRAFERLQLNH